MANITFSEGSGVNDSVFGKSQAPIRMMLEKRGEAFEQKSALPYLFNMEKSSNWAEKLTTLTALDNFKPVGENGAYPVTGMQEGYSKTIEHMVWRSSFSISREMVADSKTLELKAKPLGFISSAYRTREEFGAALFGAAVQGNVSFKMNGFAFSAAGADGKALFNSAHAPRVSGKNQSNLFSDEFTDDALAAAECAMQDFRGDNNEILDVSPDTILIPNEYTLKKAVFAAIGADKDPDTANNGFNFLFGRWRVIVWGYLNKFITANTKPWILIDSKYNELYNGAMWFDREQLDVKSVISDENDANVWKGYMRFGAGFNDWRFASCGGISGGSTLISAGG